MSSIPSFVSLLSILLIHDPSVAFAPASHHTNRISQRRVVRSLSRHAGREDRRYSSSSQEFTKLNSSPIRKSGSLFGLFDFTSIKNSGSLVSEDGNTPVGNESNVTSETLGDLAMEDDDYWIESGEEHVDDGVTRKNCNWGEEQKVTASDDSETITIIHHKKKSSLDESRSKAFNWDDGGMQKQREDLKGLSSSSLDDVVDEEEEIDEIANSLLMSPTVEGTAKRNSLYEKRDMIKMKATQVKQREVEMQDEFTQQAVGIPPEQRPIEDDATMDVALTRQLRTNNNDSSSIAEDTEETSMDSVLSPFNDSNNIGYSTRNDDDKVVFESRPLSPTHSIEKRSLSPTHSIQDDYAKMHDTQSINENQVMGTIVKSGADLSMSEEGVDLSEEDDAKGNRIMADLVDMSSNISTTSTFTDGDAKLQTKCEGGVLFESMYAEPVQESKSFTQTRTNEEIHAPEAKNDALELKHNDETSPPLQSFLSAATSFLNPTPPFLPPSDSDIINSNSANSNLVEINAHLQQTLRSQRGDLGRLRRKINDLERQLIRANRSKRTKIEDEVNARVHTVREECKRQVDLANDTVAFLEEEIDRLKTALEESTAGFVQNVEEKERVAAEYGFLAKAYVDVKHTLDSRTKEGKETNEKLERQLADATQQLERYQKETRQWKDECINKANLLDSSNIRLIQLQSTIDGLQTVIRTKEDEIKSMMAAEARDRQRILSVIKQELQDEYEDILAKKSKKIGELRMALRSANGKRRHIERVSQRETSDALKALRREVEIEMDELNALLAEKELELVRMKNIVEEAEGAVEERERLLAEVMFLTKSLEQLQANLTKLKDSYEEETSLLRQTNADKADEIEGLVQYSSANLAKISLLESQLDKLSSELQEQHTLNANKQTELNTLAAKLVQAEANAHEYNKQLDLLRHKAQSYQTKLVEMHDQVRELEEQKLSIERKLIDERERSETALDEKVTCIAILDRELAEKLNALFSLNTTLNNVNHQLEEMSNRYAAEKERANALEASMQVSKKNATSPVADEASMQEINRVTERHKRKTIALAQKNLLAEQVINKKLDEIRVLKKKLDEITASSTSAITDNRTIAELQSEIAVLTVSSRKLQAQAEEKLLLQRQTIKEQQEMIDSLTSKIESMEKSTSIALAQAGKTKNENESAMKHLKMALESTRDEFSTWKATANEKILTTNNALKSKEERILQLQDEIDRIMKTQQEAFRTSSEAEDASSKAKEKLLLKNQLLKEKDDIIARLNTQLNDLQFENKRMEQTLQEEMKRNEEFFLNHELQIQATTDKLNKQHAADINRLEKEMNETVCQLEMEIRSLKNELGNDETSSSAQSLETSEQIADTELVQELQAALQQRKEKEVALINQNMMMKQKIKHLEAQSKLLLMSSSASGVDNNQKAEIELPSYYKEESKRSRIRRVVGGIWRRVFRQNNV